MRLRVEYSVNGVVLVDTLVEYSDSVRISYSLVDTSRDVLRLRGYYRRETIRFCIMTFSIILGMFG